MDIGWVIVFVVCSSLTSVDSIEVVMLSDDISDNLEQSNYFPTDFLFGAATAAYQIEGGWNANGKGLNIWDQLTHDHPDLIADKSNADVGPDSYDFYAQDIEALKETKMNYYRFSISWSRILPDGDISSLNPDGIAYYNNLINKLLKNGIEPMVTMYHNDLPAALQDLGGFANSNFVNYFEEYANILFSEFGDRVKRWVTFNEPFDNCVQGYGTGEKAPLVKAPGVGEYYCVHNVLKAHAKAYHLYKKIYFNQYNGKIGITLDSRFYYSQTNDTDIVYRALQFGLGWLAHPIYSKSGGYPPVMVETIASNSVREGRKWSRLPFMTQKWKSLIRGSADFFGLNYYTSRYVLNEQQGHQPSWQWDSSFGSFVDPNWKQSKSTWLYNVPQGIGDLLRYIKDEYDDPEIFITENGWSDDGELNDIDRIDYLRDHLREVLKAINEDDVNVKGYTMWSLIDNFEWLRGYTEKFGLYSVNFNSTKKERTAKKSAGFMKSVIETRAIPDN